MRGIDTVVIVAMIMIVDTTECMTEIMTIIEVTIVGMIVATMIRDMSAIAIMIVTIETTSPR
ncbi:hypothetical protein NL64_08870 [Pseudomonas fluorescens]|jgi:hypothetical protein|nr:hypothetical protein NL64_08870 [Pseudomonas fluorescens]